MIPTRVGQKFEGGHFTGVIRVGESVYAIIVAPKNTQVLGLPCKKTNSATANTQSVNDGWANTRSMNDPSHPAAQYCCNIAVGGYTDWYLPSRDELELCYRYLKPTADDNFVYSARQYFTGNLSLANGSNSNSIPVGTEYTTTTPTETIVTIFYIGSAEAFDTIWYRTSTEYSSATSNTIVQGFYNSLQDYDLKTHTRYIVRAVRRVLIAQGI